MAFDASPSWSGFNYQGKVALYYALKTINTAPVGLDLSNYALMLEDNEDFEILNNRIPISFHQVKAYNSSAYSSYSDAFLEITLELFKNTNVIGRIHTWKPIGFKSNIQTLTDSIKDDLNIIINEYETATTNIESTIIGKAASNGKCPKKKIGYFERCI